MVTNDPRAHWSAKLDDLHEAIRTHPGMQAQNRWSEIKRSLDVFDRNALELLTLLQAVEADQDLQVALLAQPEPEDIESAQEGVRSDYYQQLDQRLANFVASFAALIDHTRRAMSAYKGTSFAREFDQRNATIRDQAESRFFRKLRNMLLHCGSAPLGVRFRFGVAESKPDLSDPGIYLSLDCAVLLQWDGWNQAERSYIRQAGPSMRLLNAVAGTYTSMRAIYDWLAKQVIEVHAKDSKDVNKMISLTHEMLDYRSSPAPSN